MHISAMSQQHMAEKFAQSEAGPAYFIFLSVRLHVGVEQL